MGFTKTCSKISIALATLLTSSLAYSAEQQMQGAEDDYINTEFFRYNEDSGLLENIFEGTSIGTRYRLEGTDGDSSRNRLQMQLKMKMNFELTDNLDLHIQPQTGGDGWSSGWNNAKGFGVDDSEVDFTMNLRRLYLEGRSGDQVVWQMGSMPSRAKGDKSTPLNLDTDGWVDGFRVMLDRNSRLVEKVNLTLGSLDLSDPDFYERSWNVRDESYVQVQVIGKVTDRLKYLTEFNKYNDEETARAQMSLDVEDIMGFLATTVYVEQLVDTDDGFQHSGRSIGLLKEKNNWRVQGAYVDNRQSELARKLTAGPTRPKGKMLFGLLEKKVNDKGLSWFIRLRHCVGGECDGDYRYEAGVRKKFGR